MGNLWVATLNGWVRADQIVHVTAEEQRYTYSGKFDVMVRTQMLTGSWSEPGDGGLDPLALSLYQSESKKKAQHLAREILIGLIVHADSRAVLRIIDGEVSVISVGETDS